MPRSQTLVPQRRQNLRRYVRDRFGDGSDGAATISVSSDLSRDMYYSTLTINAGVVLQMFNSRLFVRDSLIVNGSLYTFQPNFGAGQSGTGANNSSNNGVAQTGFQQQIGNGSKSLNGSGQSVDGPGGATGAGNPGANGTNQNMGYDGGTGGNGGAGGLGSSGAGGAAGNGATATLLPIRYVTPHMLARNGTSLLAILAPHGGLGGGCGGSGGGDGTNFGGGGGAGGRGGGIGVIFAKHIAVGSAGLIDATGVRGGDGGGVAAPGHGLGNCGGGGGAGGGGGGVLLIVYESLLITSGGAITAAGGAGGTGGTKTGTGVAGSNGAQGGAGKIMKFNVLSGNWE